MSLDAAGNAAPILPQRCPFKAGDIVVYRPAQRASQLKSLDHDTPAIGESVVVERIVDGAFVIWRNDKSLGQGLYWTEFSAS